MLRTLWNDELGVIVSAELVLVLTIAVLAMIVGLSEMAVAVNTELNDLSNAFGNLHQSYTYTGFKAGNSDFKVKSSVTGSTWHDDADDCDNNLTCELVCGASTTPTDEKP